MRLLIVICLGFIQSVVQAQVSVDVPGTAQISLAGQPAGAQNINGDSAPLNSPIEAPLPVIAGQALRITASGTVGTSSSNFEAKIGPDGAAEEFTDDPFGVSRIIGPSGALIGVFLGGSVDNTSKPPNVTFTGASATRELLYPMLQQPFFVGSGQLAARRWRTVIAPTGARRLFLGVLSLSTRRNTGSFAATISIVPVPLVPGNPLRVYGDAQITLAGQPPGASNVNGDTAPLNAPAQVDLTVKPGQVLRIAAIGAVGTRQNNLRPTLSPDGGPVDFTDVPFSISKIIGPSGALVGVFLGLRADAPKPPDTDYTSAASRDLPTISPLLQQAFFIGTGSRTNGELKRFVVPPGATRLFLGVLSLSTRTNTGSFIATLSPEDAGVPQFTADDIRNAAGFRSGPLAPGMVASLAGKNLAERIERARVVPLPDALGGTRVWFDLDAAPLFYASDRRVDLHVPDLSVTSIQLVVTRGGVPGLPITVPVAPYNPGIFTQDNGDGVIVNAATGNLVSDSEPAHPSDILTVYATGLGPVYEPVPAGTATPETLLSLAVAPVAVRLGDIRLSPPLQAWLAPGLIGVFQVNFQIPAGAPPGNTTLTIEVAGTISNSVSIPILLP